MSFKKVGNAIRANLFSFCNEQSRRSYHRESTARINIKFRFRLKRQCLAQLAFYSNPNYLKTHVYRYGQSRVIALTIGCGRAPIKKLPRNDIWERTAETDYAKLLLICIIFFDKNRPNNLKSYTPVSRPLDYFSVNVLWSDIVPKHSCRAGTRTTTWAT